MAKDFSFMNKEAKTFGDIPLYKLSPDFRERLSKVEKMSKEEKENYLLIITKMNEEHSRKTSKYLQFFFWITIISMIIYIAIFFILSTKR